MTRKKGLHGVVILASFLSSLPALASRLPALPAPASSASAPLAGLVTWKNVRIPGATVVIRGLSPGLEPLFWVLRTDKDGSFVRPSAPSGSYSVSAFAGASKAQAAEVQHAISDTGVSFVSLELDRDPRIIPERAAPKESPWTARAVESADPLRETSTPEEPPTARLNDPLASPQKAIPLERLPVRATVASVAGRDLEAGSAVSRTSIDVGGSLGRSYQWGLEGEYQSVSALKGADQSGITRFALEIAPSSTSSPGTDPLPAAPWNPQVRLETRRQALTQDTEDLRFSEHRVDCLLPSGGGSSAGVSARLISQENLVAHGPVSELFARQSDALEIQARYRTEVSGSTYLRAAAAYRSDMSTNPVLNRSAAPIREARLLAGAGSSLNSWLDLEGTIAGDYSSRDRAVTPELAVKAAVTENLKVIVSVSQRFQSITDPYVLYGQTGSDEIDLARSARSIYRGGILLSSKRGDTLLIEGVHREMASALQYLLERNMVEAVDALYLFQGDVMQELSASGTVRVGEAVHVRLALRGGTVAGGPALDLSSTNDARFEQGEATFRVTPSQTDLAVRYRAIHQVLSRSATLFENSLEAVEVSLSQGLPVPILRHIGSQWRALFAIEFAERQNQAAVIHNRRVSGGLGLSF
ncbi:MAG: carboxypeptidase-like regulatory domain-containing protein [Thermoanaerobaculia bacterium]|nr:carboxypeptidase-like regulatory domain-containing protein [Thermoanaerobaculia bacterium]